MDPIHVQFSRFVVNASKGEFGISYQLRRPVSDLIVERLPATIELVVISGFNCFDHRNIIRSVYLGYIEKVF
jgi:peptide/nickel transport system permease protein